MTFQPLKSAFAKTTPSIGKPQKRPPPFSIRFSDDERQKLDAARGVLSLAAYIRLKLFTEADDQSRERKKLARKHATPSAELAVMGQMLGGLGQSRLAANMNQIAKAANLGTLPVSSELEAELLSACAAIQTIKSELVSAMGIKEK